MICQGQTEIGGRMLQVKQEPKPKKPRKYVKPAEAVDYQVEQQSTNHPHIYINNEWMTFIKASHIKQTKNLGVTEAMDYIDDLPWLQE